MTKEKDTYDLFLGKKIKVYTKSGDHSFLYTGILKTHSKTEIIIEDRYKGVMLISKHAITNIQPVSESEDNQE